MTIDSYLNFPEDDSYAQSHLFIVYYNKEAKNYIIKFNIDGQSNLAKNVFVKMLSNINYPIKSKEIIVVQGLQFQIIPCTNGILNIIDIQKNNKRLVFKPKINNVITIGKDDNCTLKYPEIESLSKVHIQLTFNNEHWVLKICLDSSFENINNSFVGLNSYTIVDGFEIVVFKRRIRLNMTD